MRMDDGKPSPSCLRMSRILMLTPSPLHPAKGRWQSRSGAFATSNVTSMTAMFADTSAFNQPADIDISYVPWRCSLQPSS